MLLCKVTDAIAGMVLARPVRGTGGALLCPEGFTLTDTVIARMKNSNIESIFVRGGEDSGPTAEERLEALNKRFEGVDDPVLLQLKALVEDRINAVRAERST